MKKTILALAVAATMAAQANETTLFGDVKFGAEYNSANKLTGNKEDPAKKENNTVNFTKDANIGVKGYFMAGDVKATYSTKLELEDTSNVVASYELDVDGGFGQLSFGKKDFLLKDLAKYSGEADDLSDEDTKKKINGFGLVAAGEANVVRYTSPSLEGVKVAIEIASKNNTSLPLLDKQNADNVQASVSYDVNGIFVGAGFGIKHVAASAAEKTNSAVLSAGYAADNYSAGIFAAKEKKTVDKKDEWEKTTVRLGGSFNVTEEAKVYASFGSIKTKDVDDATNIISLGTEYKVTNELKLNADFDMKKIKDSSAGALSLKATYAFSERLSSDLKYSMTKPFQNKDAKDIKNTNKVSFNVKASF